jgi:ATP-binding cassette, subfamily B, bacterial
MARPHSLQDSLPSLWRILYAFWPRIRRQWPLVIGSLAALFASVALKLLEPWPLKWVFDHILKTRNVANRRFLDDFLATLDPVSILALAAGSVIVITALRALAEYGNTVGFALVGNRVLTEVRNDLYRQLQRLSLSFHTKARGGDLTVRVVGDVNMLKDVAATAMLPLAANVLILIGMAGLMLWLEWRLALLALLTLPLYWLTTTQLTRRIREASRKQRAREGEMASAAAESLAAVKDLQALSLEPVFAEQFIDRSRKCQTQNVVTARLSASLERRVDVLGALATALVLFFGVKLALNDSMSAGDLLIFLAYLKRAYNPLQDFAKYTGRLAKAAAAGERVLDVLGRTPDVRDLPDAVPAGMLRGDVCFESVSFSYETGRTVLNGIDFAMPAGSQVALVGPSGIGKSTVVNLLMRLYDPLKGRVLIDGADIRSFTLASLRSQISVVLQDGLLFAASVRDNIAYTTRDVTQAEIETVARLANAHEFIERMPQGYDTVLGERGVTLSHGQRQRIAIARAAIRNAPILILDEPTTGLDEENERTVVAALRRLAQSRTTLIVTHDLRLAARSDLILYIDQGRVVERGTHAELIKADGRYAALYHLQMANDEPTRAEVNHALAR